jgi:predicted acetyltransferase
MTGGMTVTVAPMSGRSRPRAGLVVRNGGETQAGHTYSEPDPGRQCREFFGAAGEAAWRSLLTLAAGFSSLDATVLWKGPEVEPLALLVREQDVRQVRQFRFMARVLDVPGAFSARGYPEGARGQLTLEVADDACPWVAGTWTVEVEGGEGKAARVDSQAGAARTDASGLAALFAGYVDPGRLAELGMVTGLDTRDVAFLRAVHAGPTPWSADFY